MAKSPNRLLASLSADAFSAISPHLKIVELKFGDVLAEAGSAIRQVYFPYSGAISLVVDLDVGMMIETSSATAASSISSQRRTDCVCIKVPRRRNPLPFQAKEKWLPKSE